MRNKIVFPKKISFIAGALVFLTAFWVFVLPAAASQANVWENFYQQYLRPLIPDKLLSPPKESDTAGNPAVPQEEKNQSAGTLYRPVIEYEQMVIAAVKRASPAIVSIIITKDLPILERCPYDPFGGFFDQDFQIYVPCPSGKTETRQIGGGSGFIVSGDGLIITNKHVISDPDAHYTVFTNDGRKYDARVLAVDPVYDLAIIKIEATNLPTVVLGDSDDVLLGQTAIAIGNALGEFKNTVSVGVISGIDRNIYASDGRAGTTYIEDALQTDAAINQGNSGGPLLNLKGEVIGINTAVVMGAENIGFAIPINKAKKMIESFKTSGRLMIPFLGVRYELVDEGARIVSDRNTPAVVPDSPAAKAGLKEGDIILEVGGYKIDKNNSLTSIIRRFNVGDTISIKIKRGENILTLRATLVERPDSQ